MNLRLEQRKWARGSHTSMWTTWQKKRCAPPLVEADWHALCQALFQGIVSRHRRRKLERAVGVQKPQEAQKAEALWKMNAAKNVGEEYQGFGA